ALALGVGDEVHVPARRSLRLQAPRQPLEADAAVRLPLVRRARGRPLRRRPGEPGRLGALGADAVQEVRQAPAQVACRAALSPLVNLYSDTQTRTAHDT